MGRCWEGEMQVKQDRGPWRRDRLTSCPVWPQLACWTKPKALTFGTRIQSPGGQPMNEPSSIPSSSAWETGKWNENISLLWNPGLIPTAFLSETSPQNTGSLEVKMRTYVIELPTKNELTWSKPPPPLAAEGSGQPLGKMTAAEGWNIFWLKYDYNLEMPRLASWLNLARVNDMGGKLRFISSASHPHDCIKHHKNISYLTPFNSHCGHDAIWTHSLNVFWYAWL